MQPTDIKLFINGRFLSKPVTGTERFARELVGALDAELLQENLGWDITIISPPGTPAPEGLKIIKFAIAGTHQGHLWEQWDLWRATRKGLLVSLTNSGPVLHGNHLAVIHDAAVYRTAENFSRAYAFAHQTLGRMLSWRAHLGTVSAFSRREVAELLGVKEASILLLPNGHEHILRYTADEKVLDTLQIRQTPYFLFVGSPTPNKNLLRAMEAFRMLEDKTVRFVIVGAAKSTVFRDTGTEIPAGVIMPGRLSDAEIVALYQNATALVFPSLYEGFGIPPLEAMVLGCPVLAASIPPVQEVCGNAVLYFDPLSPESMTQRMREILASDDLRITLRTKGRARYPLFSWGATARNLLKWLKSQQGIVT